MAKLQIFLPAGDEITHDLPEEKTSVGRLPENMLHLDDGSVSSRHGEILFEDNSFYVHDLGSTNGTYLNGVKVDTAILAHGDELRFGSVVCMFQSAAGGTMNFEAGSLDDAAATTSRRPADFVSTSPLPREDASQDKGNLIFAAAAAVGVRGAAAALFLIFNPSA
jgi:pSer/pThr/pTyr-binding forkhead associated (FHA) protein